MGRVSRTRILWLGFALLATVLQIIPFVQQQLVVTMYADEISNQAHLYQGSTCGLVCTMGGSAEHGLAVSSYAFIPLPTNARLLIHPHSGAPVHVDSMASCMVHQGLLQLPRGIRYLPQTVLADGRVATRVPDDTILRLPLPALHSTANSPSTCSSGVQSEDDLVLGYGDDEPALLRRHHARCLLPAGTTFADGEPFSARKGHPSTSKPVTASWRGHLGMGNLIGTEECSASLTAFRIRRISLANADASGHIIWTLASQKSRGAVIARAESAPGILKALPTLSVLLPLPAAVSVLRSMAEQLRSSELAGERTQLVLLATQPLCYEPVEIRDFVRNNPIAIHLSSNMSIGADALPLTSAVMTAWAVLAPASVRVVSDVWTRLPRGALQTRLSILQQHASCDAIFVPPGADADGLAIAARVEPVRPWHLVDVSGARIARGAWPVWHGSRLPAQCKAGIRGSLATARNAKYPSQAADVAEIDFWLGCIAAGGVICTATPSRFSNVSASRSLPQPMEEHVPAPIPPGAAAEHLRARWRHISSLRVLVVDEVLPDSAAIAAGATTRAIQIASELAAEGHSIVFAVRGAHPDGNGGDEATSESIAAIRDLGWRAFCPACDLPDAALCTECGEMQSEAFLRCRVQSAARGTRRPEVVLADDARLASLLSQQAFDLVVAGASFDRCDAPATAEVLLQALAANSVRAPLVALADDIHWLRRAAASRQRDQQRDGVRQSHALTCNGTTTSSTRARELAVYSSARLTLTLTDEDRSTLGRHRAGLPLRTLPHAMPAAFADHIGGGWLERHATILYVQPPLHSDGESLHSRRASRWLSRHVWPKVAAAVPSAKLVSIAPQATTFQGLLRTSRVVVDPRLVSSGPWSLSSAARASFSHALPLVTTTLGARGLLSSRTPGAISIGRTSEEVAAALVRLLINATAWDEQRRRLIGHMDRHMAPQRTLRELRQTLREVVAL